MTTLSSPNTSRWPSVFILLTMLPNLLLITLLCSTHTTLSSASLLLPPLFPFRFSMLFCSHCYCLPLSLDYDKLASPIQPISTSTSATRHRLFHHFTDHPHWQPSSSLSSYCCLALSYLSIWCYSVCSCYLLCFTPCCFHCCTTRSLCCYPSLQSDSFRFFLRLLFFASNPTPPLSPTHPCYLRFHLFGSGLVLGSLYFRITGIDCSCPHTSLPNQLLLLRSVFDLIDFLSIPFQLSCLFIIVSLPADLDCGVESRSST